MVEIVYWSGTGNTEAMANEIEAAVKAAGADVESVRFEDTNVDDVASKDVILLGCPAMGSEELEDSVVEPFFTDLAPKLKAKSRPLWLLRLGLRRMDGRMETAYRRCRCHRHWYGHRQRNTG